MQLKVIESSCDALPDDEYAPVEVVGELELDGRTPVLRFRKAVWRLPRNVRRFDPFEGVSAGEVAGAARPFAEWLAKKTAGSSMRDPAELRQIARGDMHGCTLHIDGAVYCWHNHRFREMHEPSALFRVTGAPALEKIAIDAYAACGLSARGEVYCWNAPRAKEAETTDPPWTAVRIGVPKAVDISMDEYDGLAALSDGRLARWSAMHAFDLMLAFKKVSFETLAEPVREIVSSNCWRGMRAVHCGKEAELAALDVRAFAASDHACLLRDAGVSCFGWNSFGEVGASRGLAREQKLGWTLVRGTSDVVELSVGSKHTCVQRSSGLVACWGANQDGRSSPFSHWMSSDEPLDVAVFPLDWKLSAHDDLSCMAGPNGDWVCWGNCAGLPPLPKLDCRTFPTPRG